MKKNKLLKYLLNALILGLILFLIGIVGYRIYNAAVEDATRRIRQEVSKSIVDTVNPLKWPGKIFGRKSKKQEKDA